MANAREFVTLWGFKIEHEKLDRVEHQLEAIKHRLEFLAAAEVAHKLFELTERFSQFAQQLQLAAESTGSTIEEFQKMSYAAGHAAVSQEELTTSMARVAKSLYAARNGSQEAQKAFAEAGFTPEQVGGLKNAQQALLALGDRLKSINDPIKRLAITQELLGRGSARMVGFLAQGSAAIRAQGVEAEKLGLILSQHQVEALVKVEHALQNFWGLLKNIGATIAAEVAPSLEYAIDDFIKFFQANRAIIELNFRNWIYNVTFALGYLWGAFKIVAGILIDVAKYFHLEGEILPTIATFGSLVLGLYAISRAIALVQTVMAPAIVLINLFRNSWLLAAAAEWVAEAPLLAIIGALSIVLILVDQFWSALTGKQSLLGQFSDWLTKLLSIQGVLGKIGGLVPGLGAISGALGQVGPQSQVPASVAQSSNSNINNNAYTMNAPMSMTVQGGNAAPGDLLKAVREGARDHMNRVQRETQRAVTPAVNY